MPLTKQYKSKKASSSHSHKRRPRHEMSEDTVDAVESEETVYDDAVNTEAVNEGITAQEHIYVDGVAEETPAEKAYEAAYEEQASSEQAQEKIHLEFYGSEIIRTKAPHIMELADTVADEWVKDGQFQGLPVGNPIAQLAAAKALRKAKDVEKKLEEKGVFIMAKMGLDYLKSKIDKK